MHVNAPSSIIGPLKPCTKHVHTRRTTILPCKPRARDKSQTGVTSATIEREPTQTHECMNTSQNQDNSEQSVHKVRMKRTPIAPYKSCPRRTRRDESSKQRHYSMPLRWATLRTTCHTRWHRNRSSHRNSNPRYCSTPTAAAHHPRLYALGIPKYEDAPTTKLQSRKIGTTIMAGFPTANQSKDGSTRPRATSAFPKYCNRRVHIRHMISYFPPNRKLRRKGMRDTTHERARTRTLHTRLHQSLTIYKLLPISKTKTCRHHTA